MSVNGKQSNSNIPSCALVYIDILQVIHAGDAHRHASFLEKYLSPKIPTFLPLSILVYMEPAWPSQPRCASLLRNWWKISVNYMDPVAYCSETASNQKRGCLAAPELHWPPAWHSLTDSFFFHFFECKILVKSVWVINTIQNFQTKFKTPIFQLFLNQTMPHAFSTEQ